MEGEAKCKFAPFCILLNSAFKIQDSKIQDSKIQDSKIQDSAFRIQNSEFRILHSALLFDLNVEHRRVVVFLEGFVGVILSGLVVVLEQ